MMDAEQVRKLSQQYAYTSIRMHEAVARKAGLSGTDHKYLGFFLQQGAMTAGELAGLTGLTTGAVTGLIDRLERRQLVKRTYAADDRRKVIIVPDTKKIMALLEPLYKRFRKQHAALLASLSAKEIAVLGAYLGEAVRIMQEATDHLETPTSAS